MERKAKQRWILVAGVVILFWTVLLIHFFGMVSPREPDVILWSNVFSEADPKVSAEIGEVHRRLKEIDLTEVSFHQTPFKEAAGKLEHAIRAAAPNLQPITFRISDDVPLDTPISLTLKNVPASKALRYLSALNHVRYGIKAGRVIEFDDLHSPEESQSIGARFSISSNSLGYEGCPPASALTLQDHLTEWWNRTKIKLRLAPAPVPVAPAAPPLIPDPFGGPLPAGIGFPPDPFGN